MTILEWGTSRPCFDSHPTGIDNAGVRFTGPEDHVLVSVLLEGGHKTGDVWFRGENAEDELGEERSREFHSELMTVGFEERAYEEFRPGGKLGTLQALSDDSFERFLQVVAEYCEG